jgi:flagellar biosynthetic protein FliP
MNPELTRLSAPMEIVALLTLAALLPAALASLTPFLRITLVLHFLRQALGTQTAPSNSVLLGLALFLTLVLMRPVAAPVWESSIQPYARNQIPLSEAYDRAAPHLKKYLLKFAREKDLALFVELEGKPAPKAAADLDLVTIMPAYVLSELKAGFQIGAVLFLPFLIIDLVAASVTLSIGMMQLPPALVSAPFKILLFVLVDGWNLIIGSLVKSLAA